MNKQEKLEIVKSKKGILCDMDGVIYHGNRLLDGVLEFVEWLYRENKHFLFLTNNSSKTPMELRQKLLSMGLDIGVEHFYTSALATANFIAKQSPNARVYVIGEPGLYSALYDKGLTIDDKNPDYVVMGEYKCNYETICKAVQFVNDGAKLIGTNPDITGPSENGIIPACRALIAPIEVATGKNAYFIGKPNALMMRAALERLGVHSAEAVMIGDNMSTDIIAGIESGMETVLVLSGVTTKEGIELYPFRSGLVLNGIGDIVK